MKETDSVGTLKGVGEKTRERLRQMGICTIRDLIQWYPRAYDIYEEPVSWQKLSEGRCLAFRVEHIAAPVQIHGRKTPVTTLHVGEGGATLDLVWYHMPYLKKILQPSGTYIFRGIPKRRNGRLTIEQPEIFTDEQYTRKVHSLQPVYSLHEGVTNKLLIRLLEQVFMEMETWQEFLPEGLLRQKNLVKRSFAIRQIHFPADQESLAKARKRLVFDEFFLLAVSLQQMKTTTAALRNFCPMPEVPACRDLMQNLPYMLTGAQQRAWEEIRTDLTAESVMNRLIQGDVGSGKTILAVMALLTAAKNGYQACMMAPTEVLAKQHYTDITQLLASYGVHTQLLIGSLTTAQRREALQRIQQQEADIIVGTHACFSEDVVYARLGLVITDEQHRFGVRQRELLASKGTAVHTMVMSATPIPRTLAIILYGDMDISVIDEVPARRLPVKSCVINPDSRPSAYRFIEKQVRMGHQAFIICPLVEKSEQLQAENIQDTAARVKAALASDVRIACLHGRMKAAQKDAVMESFDAGEIDVLISTTVVEVGINVPNATCMMVEDAQRYGLAQLHQLRGRIGRGDAQSYCIFVNTSHEEKAKERLDVLLHANDGFYIAQEDLRLRGPGDLFGIRQSGLIEFKIGDLYTDAEILKEAAAAAQQLLMQDPDLRAQEHEYLRRRIAESFYSADTGVVL